MARNEFPEALQEFERAVQKNSDHAEARYNLGLALCRLGKKDEAQEHYFRLLDDHPDLAAQLNTWIHSM